MNTFENLISLKKLMFNFKKSWFIAGGWAIDLHIGHITREHEDVEIAIFRKDQLELQNYLKEWKFFKNVPNNEMKKENWIENEFLELPIHEIHGSNKKGMEIEILLNECDEKNWIFRRNKTIKRDINKVGLRDNNGFPYLCPEIVLLYKAKKCNEKDNFDFHNVLEYMNLESKEWLKDSLKVCYSDHKWLKVLKLFFILRACPSIRKNLEKLHEL